MIVIHTPHAADRKAPAPAKPCTLQSFLRDVGVAPSAPCGGTGRCGNCRVRAFGDLSAPDEAEVSLLGKELLAAGVRLACRAQLVGPNAEIFLDAQDDISAPAPKIAPLCLLHPLGASLGVAVDLGTTTIAAALYDLKSGALLAAKTARNPQSAFGADIISRLQAALRGNAQALADAARAGIQSLIHSLLEEAGRSDLPDAAVLTANTAMLCLLFGYPVASLARAPFALPHAFGETRPLSELLPHAEGTLLIPPCLGPFLGADLVTALLDTELCHASRPTALLDLGTNGELALFDGKTLFCCSTAAGPAWEGAGIRMGCSARSGAISRVTRSGSSLLCTVLGNVPADGICGSGLIDAVACLLDAGSIAPNGRLTLPSSDRIRLGDTEVFLYQQDIRAVQAAKAAIRAGFEVLCSHAGIDCPDILLAGGFGNSLNVESAARIGLIPDDAAGRTRPVGNAALQGAAKLLANTDLLGRCRVFAAAERIDLSNDAEFSERYVQHMTF